MSATLTDKQIFRHHDIVTGVLLMTDHVDGQVGGDASHLVKRNAYLREVLIGMRQGHPCNTQ